MARTPTAAPAAPAAPGARRGSALGRTCGQCWHRMLAIACWREHAPYLTLILTLPPRGGPRTSWLGAQSGIISTSPSS